MCAALVAALAMTAIGARAAAASSNVLNIYEYQPEAEAYTFVPVGQSVELQTDTPFDDPQAGMGQCGSLGTLRGKVKTNMHKTDAIEITSGSGAGCTTGGKGGAASVHPQGFPWILELGEDGNASLHGKVSFDWTYEVKFAGPFSCVMKAKRPKVTETVDGLLDLSFSATLKNDHPTQECPGTYQLSSGEIATFGPEGGPLAAFVEGRR
jgi:hypothetical protein